MFKNKKRSKFSKGQVAIEHLAVAGFAIIIFTTAIILYYQYGGTGEDTLIIGQTQKVVNTLTEKADELASYDVGIFSELELDFPKNIEEIVIGKKVGVTGENEILIKVKTTKGQTQDLIGYSTASIAGSLGKSSGLKRVMICAVAGKICIIDRESSPNIESCFDPDVKDKGCILPQFPKCGDGKVDPSVGESCDCDTSEVGTPLTNNLDKKAGEACYSEGATQPNGKIVFKSGVDLLTNLCHYDINNLKSSCWAKSTTIETAGEIFYVYKDNKLIASVQGDKVTYYQTYEQGNIRVIQDDSGTYSQGYYPFGSVIPNSYPEQPTLLYKSLIYDPESGLYIIPIQNE